MRTEKDLQELRLHDSTVRSALTAVGRNINKNTNRPITLNEVLVELVFVLVEQRNNVSQKLLEHLRTRPTPILIHVEEPIDTSL